MIFIAGCPRRFDPRADEIHSQNPAAEAEYRAAQRQYQAGEYAAASASVQKFGEHFGEADPLSPWVRLLEARIAAAAGQLSRLASSSRRSPIPRIASLRLPRATSWVGSHTDQATKPLALQLLPPFSNQIVDGDEATDLHAVLADAYLRAGRLREALAEYALFFPRARPIEQAYVQSQVRALWPRLSPADQADAQSRFALSQSETASSSASPGTLSAGLRRAGAAADRKRSGPG